MSQEISTSDAKPIQSPPATVEGLYALANAGHLSRKALTEGLAYIGAKPSRREWQWFINTALLVVGALFLVAGIFFFFAYNWDDLHHFAKLGLVQGAILIAAALAHYLGLDTLSGKIALTAAALLVGALLALAGQIYQSTADAYTLFLYWAIYIAAWVVIGRFAPLWLLLVGLLNLTCLLFWQQTTLPYEMRYEEESLFLVNALALAGWEGFRGQGISWMQGRWWPRIVAVAAFLTITFPMIGFVLYAFDNDFTTQQWPVATLYPLFIGAVYLYYRHRHRDLLILTMMALSLIGVITAAFARLVDFDEVIMFFLLAVVVIVQAGFAATWLRNLGENT